MILINFKTYKESTLQGAINLASLADEVARETGVEIVICPQAMDLANVISKKGSCHVWCQHVDPMDQGRATGYFPVELAGKLGAVGTLLNHSEHKLEDSVLSETVTKCRQLGIKTLIFAGDLAEAVEVAKLSPDWIGYEPPELVGSSTTSVAEAKPQIIEEVVAAIPNVPILVGAGVKSGRDVSLSLERGAKAIGVASGVILSPNPKEVLLELARGFQK